MATAVEILMEARRLIAEKGWTQRAYARDEAGKDVPPYAPSACSFCSYGAIDAVLWPLHDRADDTTALASATDGLLRRAMHDSVVNFNDTAGRTRDDVIAAFDRAIELAKAAP